MTDDPTHFPNSPSGTGRRASIARHPDVLIDVHRADAAGMRSGVGSGVRWMGTSQIGSQIVRVATMLVLTRLLSPAEFGLVTLIMVVSGFLERVLGDTGTTAAVVRHPELSHGLASSVFWWNVAIGAVTSAAFVSLGTPVGHLLGDASAADLVRVVGLVAVVNSFGHVQRALLRRLLLYPWLAAVNFSNALVTGVASIAFAGAGWGEWALVVGSLIGTLVSIVIAWVGSPWRPGLIFDRARLAEISGFSANLSLQNVFGYISFAGDRFIIGRFIGTTELGYYGLANRLLRYPLQTSMQTYREVVFPTLARLQSHHQAMRRAYVRTVSGIAFLLLPFCLCLSAVSDPLVRALLGPAWIESTDVIAIMAVVGALQSLAITTGSIYLATARTDLSLRWQMGSSAVMMAAYSTGAFWGVEGVAWGFLVGIGVLTYPAFRIPLGLIGGRPRDVFIPIAPTCAASVTAALGAWATTRLVRDHEGGVWFELVGGVGVAAGIYVAWALLARPRALADLREVVHGSRRGLGEPERSGVNDPSPEL